METIFIVVGVVVVLIFLQRYKKTIINRALAVGDAVNAKARYDTMSVAERGRIEDDTVQHLRALGMTTADYSIRERGGIMKFSYIAYVLAKKGVAPVPASEKWHLIDRPGIALLTHEDKVKEKLQFILEMFKTKYGLNVELPYE